MKEAKHRRKFEKFSHSLHGESARLIEMPVSFNKRGLINEYRGTIEPREILDILGIFGGQ